MLLKTTNAWRSFLSYPQNPFAKLLRGGVLLKDMNEETNIPNNLEIDKALKEFEAKIDAENTQKNPEASKVSEVPKHKVEGIQFEVPSYGAVKYYNETDTPKMVKLVMKYSGGMIKTERQAEYVLLGLIILMFAVSFYLFFGGTKKAVLPPININEIDQSQFVQ